MSELYTAPSSPNPDYNNLIKLWKRLGHTVSRETLEDLRIMSEESPGKFKEYYNQWVYADDTYGGKSKPQDIARNFDKVKKQYQYNRAREQEGRSALPIVSLDWDPMKYTDEDNDALYAWYLENDSVPKGSQVYNFTIYKDEYAGNKEKRAAQAMKHLPGEEFMRKPLEMVRKPEAEKEEADTGEPQKPSELISFTQGMSDSLASPVPFIGNAAELAQQKEAKKSGPKADAAKSLLMMRRALQEESPDAYKGGELFSMLVPVYGLETSVMKGVPKKIRLANEAEEALGRQAQKIIDELNEADMAKYVDPFTEAGTKAKAADAAADAAKLKSVPTKSKLLDDGDINLTGKEGKPGRNIESNINGVSKTKVGQWMSRAEYEHFVKTGEIPRTNVLTKGMDGYIKQANKGDLYVEFDVDSSLLAPKNEALGWSLIKSKNDIYVKLYQNKGLPLLKPVGTNITHVYTK